MILLFVSGTISASDVVDGVFNKAISFNGNFHAEFDISPFLCLTHVGQCSAGLSGSLWIYPQEKTYQTSEKSYNINEKSNIDKYGGHTLNLAKNIPKSIYVYVFYLIVVR